MLREKYEEEDDIIYESENEESVGEEERSIKESYPYLNLKLELVPIESNDEHQSDTRDDSNKAREFSDIELSFHKVNSY